jgi:hypothetical protein
MGERPSIDELVKLLNRLCTTPQVSALAKMMLVEALTPETAKDPKELKWTKDEFAIRQGLLENEWIKEETIEKYYLTETGAFLGNQGLKKLSDVGAPLPWEPEKPEDEEQKAEEEALVRNVEDVADTVRRVEEELKRTTPQKTDETKKDSEQADKTTSN